MTSPVENAITEAHHRDWARILSAVVCLTHDLDTAEDAVQDALASAWVAWERNGVPANPAAWLTTAARNKALDGLRRSQALARKLPLLIVDDGYDDDRGGTVPPFPDDRLRLIFTCCHPALSLDARVALTLRLICGLTTTEIARLFLVPEATMAARITRAKKKISAAGIPYRVPDRDQLADRLPAVLAVVFLVFTEGHTATVSERLIRPELCTLAIELGAMLMELMPDEPEVLGLLALLRLTDARRAARIDCDGSLVVLAEQDRSTWDGAAIREGIALVELALRRTEKDRPGPYVLQAAIAALHAEARSFDETDWPQVLALYDVLQAAHPSPVAALGRAIAVGMVAGPLAGLIELDHLTGDPRLARYHHLPAARAHLLKRAGLDEAAAIAYADALALTGNTVEQTHLKRRIAELRRPESAPVRTLRQATADPRTLGGTIGVDRSP